MFETKQEELIPTSAFIARLIRSFARSLIVAGASLSIGSIGYHFLGALPWVDALLNAAMILTGMGPVDRMPSTEGKLFAAFYALYSGLAFISMIAFMTAPLAHRLLHKFHLDVCADDIPPDSIVSSRR
jgi:hypothetical protein